MKSEIGIMPTVTEEHLYDRGTAKRVNSLTIETHSNTDS
jgi:hypothetical protein